MQHLSWQLLQSTQSLFSEHIDKIQCVLFDLSCGHATSSNHKTHLSSLSRYPYLLLLITIDYNTVFLILSERFNVGTSIFVRSFFKPSNNLGLDSWFFKNQESFQIDARNVKPGCRGQWTVGHFCLILPHVFPKYLQNSSISVQF